MAMQVEFLDKDGKLIGLDIVPYPPGTDAVRVTYDVGGHVPPPSGTWQYRPQFGSPHVPSPAEGRPLFGGDTREILPGEERPLHPLITTCLCGRQITRLTSGSAWEHCD